MSRFSTWPAPFSACVIGASGGIGGALAQALAEDENVSTVLACARGKTLSTEKIRTQTIDVLDEASLAAAAAKAAELENLRLVIIAVGLLQDAPNLMPEKALRDLDGANLTRLFAINAIGPALCLKHFAPLLPRDGKSAITALSARVGSITDNAKGGWYGYRAAKAALNQLIRTSAIELGAKRKELVVLGLHPGTVRTRMSEPFLPGYKANVVFTPTFAADALLNVIATTTPAQSGKVLAWDGEIVPP